MLDTIKLKEIRNREVTLSITYNKVDEEKAKKIINELSDYIKKLTFKSGAHITVTFSDYSHDHSRGPVHIENNINSHHSHYIVKMTTNDNYIQKRRKIQVLKKYIDTCYKLKMKEINFMHNMFFDGFNSKDVLLIRAFKECKQKLKFISENFDVLHSGFKMPLNYTEYSKQPNLTFGTNKKTYELNR